MKPIPVAEADPMKGISVKKFCWLWLIVCIVIPTMPASVAHAIDNNCLAVSGTVDDSSGSISWAGSWTYSSGYFWKACNSTVHFSNVAGDYMTYWFYGNNISWVYTMASNRGSQNVWIDGFYQGTFSSYASTTRWQVARTWTGLSTAWHYIQVQVAGGGYTDVDAFIVQANPNTYGWYDDAHANLEYIGNWTHSTFFPQPANGTVSWSNNFDPVQGPDGVKFVFKGEAITYKYTKASNRGKAAVTIDGVDKGMIDLYSATTQWQQTTTYSGLSNDTHVIQISVTGQKNGASTDYYIDIDELIVSCWCRRNAQEKKEDASRGAWADISWTDPSLNGGEWSYARAAVIQDSPWRYVEFGWNKDKNPAQTGALVVYNAGTVDVPVYLPLSLGSHTYSMQYDPTTQKYFFYIDGTYMYDVNANFSQGNRTAAGGETAYGVEKMGNTAYSNLRYLQNAGFGNWILVNWNGHVPYIIETPYYTTSNGSNAFTIGP